MTINKIFINFEYKNHELLYKKSHSFIKELRKRVISTCPEALFVDSSEMILKYDMCNFEVGEKKISEIDSAFLLNS